MDEMQEKINKLEKAVDELNKKAAADTSKDRVWRDLGYKRRELAALKAMAKKIKYVNS
jgi:hypothetical protein